MERVFRLMAAVEERDGGDADAVRSWLMRAAGAPHDAAWRCDKCGTVAADWRPRCDSCGAFDGLEWGPPRASAAMAQPSLLLDSLAMMPGASGPAGAVDGAGAQE